MISKKNNYFEDVIYKKYPNIKAVGIDKCKAMLDLFKKREIYEKKDIELIEADYFEYPFEKSQYYVVITVESLHNFKYEKKREIYAKIYNATKENGFYYELDYMAQDESYEELNLEYYEKRRKKYSFSFEKP